MKKPVTDDILRQIMPHLAKVRRGIYLPFLNKALDEFEITTRLRLAAFLSQLAHESGELRYMEEIASGAAYEGRKDLGNVKAGDGRRFKGRGPIQLTGRSNYRTTGQALGLPLEEDPVIASEPENAFRIAGYFWYSHGLNELADKRQFKQITKRINGGYNGLAERVRYYERALRVLPETNGVDEDDADILEVEEKPTDEDKGVTTGTQPEGETSGSLPPTPAVEIKASESSWKTKLGSLSIPTGVGGVIIAIGTFASGLPPYAWFAFAAILIAAMVIGFLVWKTEKDQAHSRTEKLMDAGASQEKNNLRLV